VSPIREAVVHAGPGDAERTIAGVPLLLRTILTLQRSGVEECILVGSEAPRDPRVRCRVSVSAPPGPPPGSARRLIVGAGSVIDETLVRHLQAETRPDEGLAFETHGARLQLSPGGSAQAAARGPTGGTLLPADAPPERVELALLRALENPRDGYIDRLLYRRLSRPVTRLLLRTRLTPNQITIAGTLLGIAGGAFLALPTWLGIALGVVCLMASSVLDCCDGELARLRFTESNIGHLLDVTGDTLVHGALVGGLSARLIASGQTPGWPTLAALGLGIAGAFAAISWAESVESERRSVPSIENRLLDGLLSPLSTRDWYVFPLAFAAFGRLGYFPLAAAVGAHVFWPLVLIATARALRRSREAAPQA
jgi:phosphatidylglycerophosphate synthase